jgi:GTPase involved in cell partitioning and DNA repair
LTDLRSLESELEALEDAVRKKNTEIEKKKIDIKFERLKHEEELMNMADETGVIEEVSRNLRERGSMMTLNEILVMSQQI